MKGMLKKEEETNILDNSFFFQLKYYNQVCLL